MMWQRARVIKQDETYNPPVGFQCWVTEKPFSTFGYDAQGGARLGAAQLKTNVVMPDGRPVCCPTSLLELLPEFTDNEPASIPWGSW